MCVIYLYNQVASCRTSSHLHSTAIQPVLTVVYSINKAKPHTQSIHLNIEGSAVANAERARWTYTGPPVVTPTRWARATSPVEAVTTWSVCTDLLAAYSNTFWPSSPLGSTETHAARDPNAAMPDAVISSGAWRAGVHEGELGCRLSTRASPKHTIDLVSAGAIAGGSVGIEEAGRRQGVSSCLQESICIRSVQPTSPGPSTASRHCCEIAEEMRGSARSCE